MNYLSQIINTISTSIKSVHYTMLNDKHLTQLTQSDLQKIMEENIGSTKKVSKFSQCYKSTFNNLYNLCEYTLSDKKQIKLSETFIEKLMRNSNLDMTEIRKNSETISDKNYYNIVQYVAGNCWLNAKLSHGFDLTDIDKNIMNSINEEVENTKPLSYGVTLFHGFELYTKYNEESWKIGNTFTIPGFVSKTPHFGVAHSFARSQNLYFQKYLVVTYPSGSKHINLNIRQHSEEYEYLTKSNESFKLIDIHHSYYFAFPNVFKLTFYVVEKI